MAYIRPPHFSSSGKERDLGHFFRVQGKVVPPFSYTLFYIFVTPKNCKLSF